MIERPLMTVDELKSMPKGHFDVMKTGCHPMKTVLQLFFKWGICFEQSYAIEEKAARKVQYANRTEIEGAILAKYPPDMAYQADIECEQGIVDNVDFGDREAECRKRRVKTDSV